jgi:ornithine cyclodeaminase
MAVTGKPGVPLRVIDANLIRSLAPATDLIGWMREAMVATSSRRVNLPLRRPLILPDGQGMLSLMPSYVQDVGAAGVKLVSLVPPERRKGSSHLGLMVLYAADGLVPLALLCGATITALRTAAVSALATEVLSRVDAMTLAILGAGEQAAAHLKFFEDIRKWKECRIWSRTKASAAALAAKYPLPDARMVSCESVAMAVDGADVVCTVTGAREPVLQGRLIQPGTHVNLVGSSDASSREVDDDLVPKSRYFVDYFPSALDQASELCSAIRHGLVTESHVAGELGEVLNGAIEGRSTTREVTVFKSVGIGSQDVVCALRVYERATRENLGTVVSI